MKLKKNLILIAILTTILGVAFPLRAKNVVELSEPIFKDFQSDLSIFLNTAKSKLTAQKIDSRQRVALVIGNANYKNQIPLSNPINDANDVKSQLEKVGFEVIIVRDGDQKKMDQGLSQFYQKLSSDSVGLFYYAGHAVSVNGENYLIPTDANLKTASDVRYETLPLGKVLDKMYEAESEVKILILDACRDNPFARSWNKSRSIQTRGLAQVQSNGEGEFIVYATQPGNVAADGENKNGIFTSHLLKHLTTPNKTIEEVFKLVRQGVAQETNKQQVPFTSNGLIGDFYFNPQTEDDFDDTTIATNSDTQWLDFPDEEVDNYSPSNLNLITATPNQNLEKMYERLEELLKQRELQKADQQTWELMKQAGNGGNKIDLTEEDLKNSCSAMKRMDKLWVKYSQAKFGFSVQQNIWRSLGGNPDADLKTYDLFALKVGWKTGNAQNSQYKQYNQLYFSTYLSPKGELPTAGRWVRGGDGGAWLIAADCNFSQ